MVWPHAMWVDDLPEPVYQIDDEPILQIRTALDSAGYTHEPATPEALRECFLDYVAAGYWRDLDLDDAREQIESGEITLADMIRSLGGVAP